MGSAGQWVTGQVQAYVKSSTINAAGALEQTATAKATIEAAVLAGSVAIAAGGVGVSVSGAGVIVINSINTDIKAFIEEGEISVGRVALTADDDSWINAIAGAASVAATFAAKGGAVSVGAALAANFIDNDVAAYIANAAGIETKNEASR